MTLDQAKAIVREAVEKHGGERAKVVLGKRADRDPEFKMACAMHGAEIFKASVESIGETRH